MCFLSRDLWKNRRERLSCDLMTWRDITHRTCPAHSLCILYLLVFVNMIKLVQYFSSKHVFIIYRQCISTSNACTSSTSTFNFVFLHAFLSLLSSISLVGHSTVGAVGEGKRQASFLRILNDRLISEGEQSDVGFTEEGPAKGGFPSSPPFQLLWLRSRPCTFGNSAPSYTPSHPTMD